MPRNNSILFFCIFIFCLGSLAVGQTRIDSLLNVLKNAKHDTVRARLYVEAGNLLEREKPDSSLFYYQKALTLIEKEIQRHDVQDKFKLLHAVCFRNIGKAQYNKGCLDLALEFYMKSLKAYENIKNINSKSTDDKIKKGISKCFIGIGSIHSDLGSYDKAMEYYSKALVISGELGDDKGIFIASIYLGNIYQLKGNYGNAIEYYNKSLIIAEKLNDIDGIYSIQNNMGITYAILGDSAGNNITATANYNKAINYFGKSLIIAEKLNSKYYFSAVTGNIGSLNIKLKDYKNAIKNAEMSIMAAKEVKALQFENNGYYILKEAYSFSGNYKKALEYSDMFISTKDSLYNAAKSKQIIDIQAKYETEKKDNEIILLKKNDEIKNYQIGQQKANTWLITIVSVFIIIVILAIYNFIRIRQKEKFSRELIKQQKHGILAVNDMQEKERIRIAMDLHDGIGQLLSGIKMNFYKFETGNPGEVHERKELYEKTLNLIDEACTEIRSVSHQMIPKTLINSGLKDAAEQLLTGLFSDAGLKSDITVHGLNIRNKMVEIQLYRILQEIAGNIVKHAQAKQVSVALVQDNSDITLIAEDDGIGFTDKGKAKGIGLSNMRTRVDSLNGSFSINKGINEGTIVTIKINLDKITLL